jgi:hypothetical protein
MAKKLFARFLILYVRKSSYGFALHHSKLSYTVYDYKIYLFVSIFSIGTGVQTGKVLQNVNMVHRHLNQTNCSRKCKACQYVNSARENRTSGLVNKPTYVLYP